MATGKLKSPPLEDVEDAKCAELWTLAGFTVISFSQKQKAQQTRGIADQMVLDNRSPWWSWYEVKRLQGPGWKRIYGKEGTGQSPDQKWFQQRVEQQGHLYHIGSREDVARILSEMGRVIL